MATAGLYGNTAVVVVAAPSGVDSVGLYGDSAAVNTANPTGSESSGLYGNNTVFGGTYFEWLIFKDSVGQPATPTGGSWDFTANTGTAPTGWLNSPPSSITNLLWVSVAVVSSKAGATLTWSAPGLMASASGGAAGVAISASNSQQNNGTISFANSNGVSFGLSNGVMTASAAGGGAALQGSGTYTQNTGTVQFANSNNVSFGLTNGVMTASVSQTVDTNKAGTGYTSTTQAGSTLGVTHNSNGLSIAQPAFLTTASPVSHSHGFATTTTNGASIIVGTTNSNGVTVGVPAYLTTAMGSNEAHIQAAVYSNATQTSGTLIFTGAGGISVGSGAGGSVIISFDGHHMDAVLPSGNNYGTGFSSMSSGTFGINAVGALSMSQNGNNLSFSVPAQTVDSNKAGIGYTSTTQAGSTLGVTHNTAGLSIAQPPFITTYVAQTTQTQAAGNIAGVGTTFAGTNVSGSMTNNSNGLALNLSVAAPGGGAAVNVIAGTTNGNLQTIRFQDGNGVGFGLNGSTITASYAGNPLIVGNLATSRTNVSQIAFVNTGGVSWDIITGPGGAFTSPNIAFISASISQSVDTGRAGLGTTFAGTNVTATLGMNSNGLAMSLSAGAGGGGSDGVNIVMMGTTGTTGTTFSASTGTVFFNGSNNVTVSQNGSNQMVIVGPTLTQYLTTAQAPGAYLTTARASNDAIGLNTALTANGLSVTANSSGLSINVPAWLTTAAQSNHSHNFATTTTGGSNIVVGTANSAGATIGVPPFITTYVNDLTSGRAGVGTTFAGTNASASMTMNTNGLNLALSVAAGGGTINQTGPNIAVAGSTVTSGDVYFSNSPTVTFGMAGSTITASAAGGGGGAATIGGWELFPPLGGNTAFSTMGQNTIYFQKFIAPQNISFNNIERRFSGSTVSSAISAQAAHTYDYGLYSKGTGASTSIYNLIASSQMILQASYSSNLSAGYTISQGAASFTASSAGTVGQSALTGYKHIYFPFTSTITAGGEYAVAMRMSSATTGATGPLRMAFQELSVINNLTIGKLYASTILATNASFVGDYDQGVYSATSSNLPATLGISGLTNAVSQQRMYLQFEV